MTRQRRLMAAAGATATAVLLLAGCSAGGASSSDKVELQYWLWDANQQPGYEECAAAFEDENPNISVTVKQFGWDDYWGQITNGLVAGTAPDVFTGHSAYFPTFVDKKQILPIDDVVKSDKIDIDAYQPGLADAWVVDDVRYGLPKDIGLVAMYANEEMLSDAGYSADDLQDLDWNPTDGGSYEKLLAHMTIDENGVRGDEAGFDKTKVAVYGLGLNGDGGGLGETIWGQYAVSNDWYYFDEKDGTPHFNYDSPEFLDAMAWFKSLSEKGYMPTLQVASSGIGQQDSYGAGKYAIIGEGSWSAQTLFGFKDVKSVLFPIPEGPSGHRAGPAGGLADNIAATTKHPEEAKSLLAFLGSEPCQKLIAEAGVVFPAVASLADTTKETFAENGIDVSPFYVPLEDGDTYQSPSVPNWADVNAVMIPAMQAYLNGSAPLEDFISANEQINALY